MKLLSSILFIFAFIIASACMIKLQPDISETSGLAFSILIIIFPVIVTIVGIVYLLHVQLFPSEDSLITRIKNIFTR